MFGCVSNVCVTVVFVFSKFVYFLIAVRCSKYIVFVSPVVFMLLFLDAVLYIHTHTSNVWNLLEIPNF